MLHFRKLKLGWKTIFVGQWCFTVVVIVFWNTRVSVDLNRVFQEWVILVWESDKTKRGCRPPPPSPPTALRPWNQKNLSALRSFNTLSYELHQTTHMISVMFAQPHSLSHHNSSTLHRRQIIYFFSNMRPLFCNVKTSFALARPRFWHWRWMWCCGAVAQSGDR